MEKLAVHDDWDRHWEGIADCTSRNPAPAMRRRLVRSLLAIGDGRARILDIGCGQGDMLAELRRHYPQVELYGTDYSQYGIDVAKTKVPDARFVQRDLLVASDPASQMAGWATHAVCSEVLEHVDDPTGLLVNAMAYMAPGCRLVVTVPGGPISGLDRHIGHRRHYNPDSLCQLLLDAGFEVENVTGAGFPFFNLFRLLVVMRGDRIVSDAGGRGTGRPSLLARLAMGVFRPLLSVPMPNSRLGWQIVGVACVPARDR